ncbi:unnamed protein product [Caenorhabditis sp. 36 PRJEB53466]|nr:unnamed protein product [Caenorhabditis sp. 36 PRJEB53466]
MRFPEVFILFQLVLSIFLSGIIAFCQVRKQTAKPVPPASIAVKPNKKEVKKKKKKKKSAEEEGDQSEQNFPEFVMPTESKRNKKLKEVEDDKKKKVKEGFYQEKSDQDDTLEKIASLRIEQSDRTKRAAKKKKKT